MSRDEIRFGVGRWDGLRSSTWKVWAGPSDASVYVANRDVGGVLKASLHPVNPAEPGGEWRVAWTGEYMEAGGLGVDGRRLITDWSSEEGRLGEAPLKQGFAVVIGRFSMAVHPLPADPEELRRFRQKLSKAEWADEIPGVDEAWQFTVLIGDPTVRLIGPPGRRGMNAMPVGNFELANGSSVWVMRHRISLAGTGWQESVGRAAQQLKQLAGDRRVDRAHRVLRSILLGQDDGLRYFMDVAVTFGAPDAAFES